MAGFNKHIIIIGTARSGTSWLSETIARQFRYRMLFEPEQETRTKHGHLICDQWIQTEEDSPKGHAYLKKVFQNRVDCDWIAQNSNRKFKRHLWPFVAKKFIIKFVRANLAGHYMNESFGIPVIHMIRNPYDVIASQKQAKFPWLVNLDIFLSQPKLLTYLKLNFNIDITNYQELQDVEVLALRWCIENVITIQKHESFSPTYKIIKYEDLVADIGLFYNLCETFDLKPIDNLDEVYKKPSSKTHPEGRSVERSKTDQLLTTQDIAMISRILVKFNCDLYPITNNLKSE